MASTNNGMSVDLNAPSLNAVKATIVVPTTKDVQPSVNQDVNVLKELVHFLTVTPYFRLKSGILMTIFFVNRNKDTSEMKIMFVLCQKHASVSLYVFIYGNITLKQH